jgi:hypothetical protein
MNSRYAAFPMPKAWFANIGEPTVGIGFPEIIVTFLIDKPQLGNGFLGLKRGYNPRQQKQQRLESGLQHPQK